MRKLFDRTPAEAGVILRSLKAVATAEGTVPFKPIYRATLETLLQQVLRAKLDLGALGETLPVDLSRSVVDSELRANLVHLAIALPFLEPEHESERAAVARKLAARFGLRELATAAIEKAARSHHARLALEVTRGAPGAIGGGIGRTVKLYLQRHLHRDDDPALLERTRAFATHADGTVGRALLDYWRDNEFPLPGEPGAMRSPVSFEHDVHHVLSGYDTSPRGELAIAGFFTGLGENDYADFTGLLLLQLQVAVQLDPTLAAWREQFEPAVYFAAVERAERCSTNVASPAWDPWSIVDQPLADVRRVYGISEDEVMVRDAHDRWCGTLGPPSKRVSPEKVREAGA